MGEIALSLVTGIIQALYLDWNFVELALILLLVAARQKLLTGFFDRFELAAAHLARRRGLCITCAFLVPILFRLAVLPWVPMPQPGLPDEFSHQLLADTLLHGRFANPAHPMWTHFETIHEIFQPLYASVYFPGPGLALALGKLLAGQYWAGVLLSSGAMCAALLWMMYGFFPPRWALLGGAIAVLKWGALSYWVNSYWGGTVAALAGALVLGAYARVRRSASVSNASILGAGLVLLAYSRPLEGMLLSLPVALALLWHFRKVTQIADLARVAVPIVLILTAGMIGLGIYFKGITGNPLLMPYRINQQLYGWPLTLPWDHPQPVSFRNSELQFYYIFERCLQYRKIWPTPGIQYSAFTVELLWRIFLGPALTIPFLAVSGWWRDAKIRLPLVCVAVSLLTAVVLAAYPHYVAPATGCCLALTIQAFRYLRVQGRNTTRSGLAWSRIAVLALIMMLPIRAFVDSRHLPHTRPGHHSWSSLGGDQGAWRAGIVGRLNQIPGAHLVFVQYNRTRYLNTEWVYNEADIDRARVVWARDLGPTQNQEVLRYYPDRKPWLVTPDDAPDALLPYDPARSRPEVLKPVDLQVCPSGEFETGPK